jgi:FlaA1/EpsC-like NDP-sugar epimerase
MVFILLIYSPRFLYEYRDEIIGSYLISLIVIISYRIVLLRKIFLKRKSEMMPANNVIIVGSSKIAKNVALKAIINNPIEINLIGFVDDNIEKDTKILSMFNVLGRIDDLDNITAKFRVDEIIIAVENVTYEQILEIIDKCRRVKIPIRIYSEIFNVINENLPVEKYAEIPLVDIRPLKNPRLFIFYKRVVDLLSASLILIVLTPFFLILD